MSAKETVIEVRGLRNQFGEQVVHENLDLDVYKGEILGVVGGSGSGKSVLLRSIIGLNRPAAGSIKLFGQEVTRLSDEARSALEQRCGVLFQNGALFSSLTVAENVMVPLREHHDLPMPLMQKLAALKIALAGLPADAGAKYPAQLSGGMIKRAALARALALDPQLLMLDEPTAGLDPISAAAFDELLMDLRQQLGLTVIMITHDLDTIFRTCNRVGVIIDRKMTSDTLEGITRNPHPWIQAYFHGERAQRFGQKNER
jgi:phospholipid/cholesterol/gamma-HCH transport system ATP-binding protein